MKIAVLATAQQDNSIAQLIAGKFSHNLFTDYNEAQDAGYKILLIIDGTKIGILKDNFKPFFIDFNSSKINFRKKSNGKELLIRALDATKLNNPVIIDATAGLGNDSFIIASFGYKVNMVERSPIVNILLQNAIERGLNDKDIYSIIKNMNLINDESINVINNLPADIIYMDPMFDKKDNSALVKKEMRIFRDIVGNDDDAGKLFELALSKANYRVILKRPRKSPTINSIKPTYSLSGSACRFDVYSTHNKL
jgi:16S rRNA (guanine1516-N2)-methyltransferase